MSNNRRLKTAQDVRRYLASLINRTEAGEVDPNLAGKLCYMANSLVKIIEISDLEERVEKLEAAKNTGLENKRWGTLKEGSRS